MKRMLPLILIFCLGLAGCGGGDGDSQAPATPRPVEYIDIAEAQPLVEEFIASDTLAQLQAEFTRQIGSVVQGPWLSWMVGFAMDDMGGESVDYVIFRMQGDVANMTGIGESFTVLYDRDTQTFYDSMTTDFDSWHTTYTGEVRSREDGRNILLGIDPGVEGSVIYHHQARERWLSKTDVAAINAALNLTKPQPRTEKGLIETVMETTNEERLSAIAAAAEVFFASDRWQTIATDPLSPMLAHAMEYKNDDFNGQPVHVLLMKVAGVDRDFHSPHLLVDMSDGAIYTEANLDMNSMEHVFERCLSAYMQYVEEDLTELWGEGEVIAELAESELAAINAPYMEAAAARQAEAEAAAAQQAEQSQQLAAALTDGLQNELYALATAFRDSPRYAQIATDPQSISLTAAMEYVCGNLEGYHVNVLMLATAGVDTNHHGFLSSMALLDRNTGKVYTEADLDMDNWGDFARLEHAFAAALGGFETKLTTGQDFIWTEEEVCANVSPEDLAAVNAALNP